MRIRVVRPGGQRIEVEAAGHETAAQVATRAAVAFGFDVFDAPWCLGEGETFMVGGGEGTAWVPQVAPVSALDEGKDYLLAVMPATKGWFN